MSVLARLSDVAKALRGTHSVQADRIDDATADLKELVRAANIAVIELAKVDTPNAQTAAVVLMDELARVRGYR